MQPGTSFTGMQTMMFAPPYPAALVIPSAGWRSHLARDGKIPLAKPVIQIGRMEGNDIILTDPLVSRHHAVVRWTPGGYEVEDLGAPNGTFIEGQRVTGRVALAPGNLVRLGNTEMVFQVMSVDTADPGASAAGRSDQSQTQTRFAVRPALPGRDAIGPDGRVPDHTGGLRAPAMPVMPAQPERAIAPPMAAPQFNVPLAMPASPPVVPGAHPYYAMLAQSHQGQLAQRLRSQASKRYWRVFLLGLLAYGVVAQVTSTTTNLHLVPLEMLLASALVPVVFVIFCWEQNAFADMPASVVGITFASGAVLGICLAAIFEPLLIPHTAAESGITLPVALIVGLVEETAKVISVVWFLRNRQLRSELDGLILGAAAGMGFAALETAGYGFQAFLQRFVGVLSSPTPGTTIAETIQASSSYMNHQLLVRMALAVFGHGVWTAIVCAAIWRDRGRSVFRLTGGVLAAFAIAVGLHALWDWSPLVQALGPQPSQSTLVLVTVLWYALIGSVGLLVLRFFLTESLQRAKLGPYAPPPPPLLSALMNDVAGLFGGGRQPVAQAWGQPAPPPTRYGAAAPNAQAQRPVAPQPAPRPMYCPACSISYPPQTLRCSNCGGPVFPVPL